MFSSHMNTLCVSSLEHPKYPVDTPLLISGRSLKEGCKINNTRIHSFAQIIIFSRHCIISECVQSRHVHQSVAAARVCMLIMV